MDLKLGKMTTKELAEWMGIKYNTFRINAEKRYEILKQYCVYEKKYGYVEIQEIFEYKFKGDLRKKDVEVYVEEVRAAANGLATASGIARKIHRDRDEYKELKINTIRNRMSNAGIEAFGKTNFPDNLYENSGPYGHRDYIWAVKVSDYNDYRYLSDNEEKKFNELLEVAFSLPAEKAKQLALLDQSLKDKSIGIDEYFTKRETLGLWNFKGVLQQMYEDCGIIIVRCTRHEITKDIKESAF